MKEEYKNQLIENGADIKNALKHFMNKEDMYERYLTKFFLEEPNYDNLLISLENGDYSAAFRYVHTLKGVSINLGLIPLYNVLFEMTEELRGKSPEDIDVEKVRNQQKELTKQYQVFADVIRNNIAG